MADRYFVCPNCCEIVRLSRHAYRVTHYHGEEIFLYAAKSRAEAREARAEFSRLQSVKGHGAVRTKLTDQDLARLI